MGGGRAVCEEWLRRSKVKEARKPAGLVDSCCPKEELELNLGFFVVPQMCPSWWRTSTRQRSKQAQLSLGGVSESRGGG